MKVLVFCAKGFETVEFGAFIDVMGWAGNDFQLPIEVDTCGFTGQVISTFNIPVLMDKTLDEVTADDYDALPIAKSGVLAGRRATTYHLSGGHRQRQLALLGAEVVNERVVIDDNVITSYCPETAVDVAFELLRKLCGSDNMCRVKQVMGYDIPQEKNR